MLMPKGLRLIPDSPLYVYKMDPWEYALPTTLLRFRQV